MMGRAQRVGAVLGLAAAGLGACTVPPASSICATSVTVTRVLTSGADNNLDVVFVLDDGAAMAGWQATLAAQLPSLMMGLPYPGDNQPTSLHVGVISSDMGLGAAANAGIPGCNARGDGGVFRSQPEGMCTATTLDPSAAFISEDGDIRDFSAADDPTESGAAKVFQCIAQLGDGGCGFGQPLAALDRALGADGEPPPAANAGFLRPDAYLLIVFISSQDDCSAPVGSAVFSTADPARGPLTPYRCNHAGHLCLDPSGHTIEPPIDPPSDAVAVDGVPTLSLASCQSNDAGGLTPVSKFIADIRSLKSDPDNQIFVTGLVGPPTPYAVEWLPDATSTTGLRAQVVPSCGTEAADGSGAFGEPAVRLAQFIGAFSEGFVGSVCDASYLEVLDILRPRLAIDTHPPCLTTNIQIETDADGRSAPDCVVSERLRVGDGGVKDIFLPACATVAAGSPCWSIGPSGSGCPAGQGLVTVTDEPVGSDPANYSAVVTLSCQLPPADTGSCPD